MRRARFARPQRIVLVTAALLGGLVLSGCVVAPLPPADGAAPVVIAPSAPPPPPAEAVVVAPGPGYVWITGYWGWVGGRHVWTQGRWVAPRPGYRWVPRRWAQGPGGWHQHGGYWAR